jgi:hypothetical protein
MTNNLPDVIVNKNRATIAGEIFSAIEEVQQSRSRFQLESFVIRQHDTPQMQYYQACIELQDMLYKYQRTVLGVKKTQVEIARLRESGDEVQEIEAQIMELDLQQTLVVMNGAEREIEHLVEIWDSFPKFTREEIEAAEPHYWELRLTRQVEMQALGQGHVDMAQLDAMRQAGFLESFLSKQTSAAKTTEESKKVE